ncbi:MAG: transglutaminase family protein, partial [Chthoniobacterales bacterium]
MKIHVRYKLHYAYEGPVGLGRHEFRILPRQDHFQQIEGFSLCCEGENSLFYRRDAFDNEFVSIFFKQPVDSVKVNMEFTLHTTKRNPYNFLLDKRAEKFPLCLVEEELKGVGFYLPSQEDFSLPEELKVKEGTDVVRGISLLNEWHFENIGYEVREEGDALPPDQTLLNQRGACRDTSLLFAEVLRRNGVPTRLVSGFLAKSTKDETENRAENALHAWVEAYLPGAG